MKNPYQVIVVVVLTALMWFGFGIMAGKWYSCVPPTTNARHTAQYLVAPAKSPPRISLDGDCRKFRDSIQCYENGVIVLYIKAPPFDPNKTNGLEEYVYGKMRCETAQADDGHIDWYNCSQDVTRNGPNGGEYTSSYGFPPTKGERTLHVQKATP